MAKLEVKPGESRAEAQLRAAKAKLELLVVKERTRQAKAMLAVHAAADRGRRNRDWNAPRASADAAVIPDSETLIARARQCVRDSWVGQSVVKAFSRNVVGCGIMPVPMAKDASGKLLPKVNAKLIRLFWAWANAAGACDVEKKQTFWQKQNMIVEERITVGEHFLLWSYLPNDEPGSPVGLKLQSFEPDQLDLRLQSYTDPATQQSRQVRGGVEVDEFGAAVAYHFYTRNPSDYLPVTMKSVRVPASRVFHYFKQTRVLQTRGVTPLAPILQDVRDFGSLNSATLWRTRMEACIGGVITQEAATAGASGIFGESLNKAPGDPGQTSTGMPTVDFAPGMIARLTIGEDFKPFIPASPGNQYEPYTKCLLRGIGAGVGLSYGQIARQSESNYSAARQDMLEDRKEIEPEQEMLAHNVLLPIWRLFVRLAVLEGKLEGIIDGAEFAADPDRFCEAEYVAPPAPWIDPEKEANAYAVLIEQKLIDREEVIGLRGKRIEDVWDKIQYENTSADKRGIALPENKERDGFRRDIVLGFVNDGTVCDAAANQTDIPDLWKAVGLPLDSSYEWPWLAVSADPGPLVGGEPVKDAEGKVIGGGVIKNPATPAPTPLNGINGKGKGGGEEVKPNRAKSPENKGKGGGEEDDDLDLLARREKIVKRLDVAPNTPTQPPGYRAVGEAEAMRCATCTYLVGAKCAKYNAAVELNAVCDTWEASPVSRDDQTSRRLTGPFKTDGEPELGAVQSSFTQNPAHGKAPDGPAGISS